MKQTGHRSVQMVRRYIRDGSLFPGEQCGEVGAVGPSGVAPGGAILCCSNHAGRQERPTVYFG
jgi:hypothetical protein